MSKKKKDFDFVKQEELIHDAARTFNELFETYFAEKQKEQGRVGDENAEAEATSAMLLVYHVEGSERVTEQVEGYYSGLANLFCNLFEHSPQLVPVFEAALQQGKSSNPLAQLAELMAKMQDPGEMNSDNAS